MSTADQKLPAESHGTGEQHASAIDPAFSLQSVEIALRRLIREVLGSAWVTARGAPDLSQLEAKAEEDRKRRDGAAVIDDLLSYTEFYSLADLIEKNWEKFKPALGDLQRTKVFLGIIADFRNSVAHSRVLLDFERNLLAGAAGQLRNQIALYVSRNDGPHRYYPVIESITNDYGVIEEKYFVDERISEPRLTVGDSMSFTCVANDPQGRPLKWLLSLERRGYERADEVLDEAIGNSVVLKWKVLEKHVGEKRWLAVTLKHSGQYHRWHHRLTRYEGDWGEYDDTRSLMYNVNPPV